MPPSFADPIPCAPRPAWLRLTDLLIAVLLVLAVALISSFLGATTAHAQQGPQALPALHPDSTTP